MTTEISSQLQLATTAWRLDATDDANEITRQAVIAESLGYHSFWLPESHFAGQRSLPSPMMLLAAVAAATRRIRLGSTSYLLPIRHPLHAAEEVAVLDCLSGGRVILGVGRGVQDTMFEAFSVDRRQKRTRFRDNLALMIRAWRGKSVVDGDVEVILSPLPVQRPHPPIWVAAFGPLAIKQAGSLGLPYLASPVETLAQLADNYARHAEFVSASGFPVVTDRPVMRTVYVSDRPTDVAAVKASLQQAAAPVMRDQDAEVDDWTIVGDAVQVRDKIAEYVETLGMTHLIVRGRISGVEDAAWTENLERLAKLAG